MDWHKLQRTLYNLDPVDTKQDLAKLRESVSKSASIVDENVDYANQSYQVPEGSMPTDRDYSVSDFAALAGIKLTEGKQKEGRPGQAKHSDPKPKKLPAGSTKNVSKGKLVGDSIDNNLEEGPVDSFKQGFATGRERGMATDYVQNKVQSALNPSGDPAPEKPKKTKVNPQRISRLIPVDNPQYLISALRKHQQDGSQSLTRQEINTLADAFSKLIDMDPRQTTRVMQALKQMQTTQQPTQEPTEHVAPDIQESIKERLYRELRQKGL